MSLDQELALLRAEQAILDDLRTRLAVVPVASRRRILLQLLVEAESGPGTLTAAVVKTSARPTRAPSAEPSEAASDHAVSESPTITEAVLAVLAERAPRWVSTRDLCDAVQKRYPDKKRDSIGSAAYDLAEAKRISARKEGGMNRYRANAVVPKGDAAKGASGDDSPSDREVIPM